MLYDKRWDKPEIKADPLSLESLIAWLEKQPAGEQYDYCNIGSCLVAQYLKSHGVEHYELAADELKALGWHRIAGGWDDGCRRTFGAALARAKSALASG